MKGYFFLLASLMILSSIAMVSASSCTKSGFDWCEENTYQSAHAQIYFSLKDDSSDGKPSGSYAVGRLYLKYGYVGDELYFLENVRSWDDKLEDSDNGLYDFSTGSFSMIGSTDNTYPLASMGQTFKNCVGLVAQDFNGGYWTWTGRGWMGSGNCFNIKVVECESDSDCDGGATCNSNKACESKPEGYCESSFDCPAQIITEKYCEDKTLKQKTTENQCGDNNQCSMTQTSDNIVESCEYSCGENDDGIIECLTQPTITIFRLENAECTEMQIIEENKQTNDYDTLEDCQSHISNINWTLILWTGGIIGAIILIVIGYVFYKRRK